MRIKSLVLAASILIIILFQSCQKEASEVVIDSALLPYMEKFRIEAASRGITADYEALGISAALTRINDENVVGQCIHNTEEPNKIVISRIYWNSIDTVKREFLIFHELGHCILNRSHLDTKDANGNCTSIMHSSEGICKFNFTGTSRIKYLDELFNN